MRRPGGFCRRRRIRFLDRYFPECLPKRVLGRRFLLFAHKNRFVPVWYVTYIFSKKDKSRGLEFFEFLNPRLCFIVCFRFTALFYCFAGNITVLIPTGM